jgi:hypothetical protein
LQTAESGWYREAEALAPVWGGSFFTICRLFRKGSAGDLRQSAQAKSGKGVVVWNRIQEIYNYANQTGICLKF